MFAVRCAVALVVAGAALTACGGQTTTRTGGVQGQVRAYDINPQPPDAVKDGGTLRWGINEYASQWNLNHIDGNLAEVKKVVDALMPAPFRSDEKAQISVNPDYVVDAKITQSAPKQVVTYTLNPRAKWSDGKPITWADYEAQWKAINGTNPAYRVATVTGYQDIQSVARGKDDFQVVVTFARPFGDWQSLFWPLYPQSTNRTPEAFNTGWLNKIPVTAGPFAFQAFDPTAKTVTIARNDGWWGRRAKLDRIIFRASESDALIGAFTNNELDVVDVGPSAPDYARAKATQGGTVRQAAAPDFRHFTLNGESEILSDVRVRQAIAKGLNRQAIAQSDLQGLDWPIVLLNNHFFMNTQEGYQDNSGALSTYDLAKAGQMLDAAGWVMSGGVRKKNGKELNLRFVIPSGLQLSKAEGELAQTMLSGLGVKLAIQSVPSDDFFVKYVIPGNYDIAPFSYIGTPFPVTSSYGQYVNAAHPPKNGKLWNANLGRIGSPQIDEAMNRAMSELDPKQAIVEANAADRLIWQQVNVLPLYQRPQTWAVRSSLANIGARGFYSFKYEDIGFMK
ncbi:peptide/nickel transport system substrate-binding protein [Sinosporangium album]|uniref:Peptide/nickel transport system substrate-binding protein n=1 Tax=Sinosporangium album TaxID=504805 RepID=A0A1G7TD77_9ACTN|nr:ABC transporter family substrate-binding protein [Sinosporangium album]SDG32984.1 peptide/nickel transport system substrate-binding protein [Sinosporangium album]